MKSKALWSKVSTWLCAAWAILILALVANRLLRLPTFEQAALEPCPPFLLQLAPETERALLRLNSDLSFRVLSWRDRKSKEIIDPFRKSDRSLHCDVVEQRAKLFLAGAKLGVIEPRVFFNFKALVALIALPCLLIVLSSYLLLGPIGRQEGQETARGRLKVPSNPSIERTSPGKPGAASHVKR